MKTIILAALLALSSLGVAAQSAEDKEKYSHCALRALSFQMAAAYRDAGQTPQFALEHSPLDLNLSARKQIINLVYFDPALRFAGGQSLVAQVINLCMNGENAIMRPLQ